jgi:pyruvate-ferredoxin/flavodoxin oxidoreductase
LDSKAPTLPLEKYIYNETRYSMLKHSKPEAAQRLLEQAQADVQDRWKLYEARAAQNGAAEPKPAAETQPTKETPHV